MAVGAGESWVTGAAEVPGRLADAVAVGAAHIGGDVPHPLLCVVSRHSNSAAVNHCGRNEEKESMSTNLER